MSSELEQLKNILQKEKQQLEEKLKSIEDKLSKIDDVYEILKEKYYKSDESQEPSFKTDNIEEVSDRFDGVTFYKAVDTILKDDPDKWWAPKEICERLLREGYQSKSADFGNIALNMLRIMRQDGRVNAKKEKNKYLIRYKKKDSVPHMVETESNVENGELPEQVKGTDL